MKKFKHWLLTLTAILCSTAQMYAVGTFDDWTSTNHSNFSTDEKTYRFTFGKPTTLEFDWSVSSESGCDWLQVYLNNTEIVSASGQQNGRYSETIAAGDYTLLVRYTKDGSVNSGSDQATISNIFVGGLIVYDGWTFVPNDSSSTVTVVTAPSELTDTVIIPTSITVTDTTDNTTKTYRVTNIGNSLFANRSNITSVTLPDSIVSIGNSVFYYCTSLKSINIPANVEYIGEYAFQYCTALDSVNYNAINCTSSSNNIFAGCSNLKTVTIGDDVKRIPAFLFRECDKLKNITLGDELTYIGESAFYGCDSLTYFNIPNSIDTIGYQAFYNCQSLRSITIPNSVEYLGEAAFRSCTTLESATVNTKRIPSSLFRDCDKLKNITLGDELTYIGSYAFYSCDSLTYFNIPNNVDSIESYALSNCQSLRTITIPNNVTYLGGYAFNSCSALDSVQYNAINCTSTSQNNFSNCPNLKTVTFGDDVKRIPANLFRECDKLKRITMEEGTTYIGDYAFYSCDSLTYFNIPNSVDTIGYQAFYYCHIWKSVNIPTSTKYIGYQAFGSCSALDSIYYNAANTPSFSSNIFDYCNNIKTITIGSDVKVIPTNLAYNRSSLRKVEIGKNVTKINSNAFYQCSNLQEINLPNSVDTIGSYAFQYCRNLKSINIPINMKYMGDYAFYYCSALDSIYYNVANPLFFSDNIFYGCSNIKKITVGDDVKEIPTYLFYNRSSVQKAEIGENVTTINNNAFNNCQSLKSVNIPKSVKSIGSYAFRYCYALDSIYYNAVYCESVPSNVFDGCSAIRTVVIGDDVKNIPSNLFYGRTSLQKVEIGENVTRINDQAFYNCQGLQSINIPNSVDTIGTNVFYNCVSLPVEDTIRYADTYALAVLDKSQVSYTLKEGTRFLGTDLFKDCSAMTSLIIPSGVIAMGDNVFYGCSALTSLTLPDTLQTIGASAFYNCSALASVNIPSKVTTIHDNTFYGCSALTSLTLPEAVNAIGSYAFYNCSSLASVNIPSGVEVINGHTFYGCSALTSLTLPETVNYIGSWAFYNCSSMESVNIPSGVEAIYDHTFYGCRALTSLTLPETIATIGESAFYNCSSLTSMTIPASVTSMANYVFYGCTGIKEMILADGKNTLSLGFSETYGRGFFGYCPLERVYFGRNLSYRTDYYGGYSPFYNIQTLTDVTIGDSLTYISAYAFYNCDALTTVDISEGVELVDVYAFYECNNLRDIKLPSTIETIQNYNLYNSYLTIVSQATTPPTFSGGCSGKVIYVPAGSGDAYRELYPDNIIIDGEGVTVTVNVTELGTLGEEALKQADYLHNINHLVVSGTLDNSDIECITNSMSNLITLDMSGMNLSNIPSSLFKDNKRLTKVILPNKTTVINSEAFRDCSRLREVVLPEALQQIGTYAFYQTYLEDVTLPDNVTSMGNYAFYNCDNLKSINIPAKLKRLSNYVFDDCRLLKNVDFSDCDSLTYIGQYAFRNCPSLTSMVLSDDVTEISNYAFYGCSSLASVTFPQSISTIGSEAFRGCALKSVEISSSLATLGTYAFYDCNNLENVTLHGATTIGEYAFASCDKLKEITFPGSLNSCGNYTLNGCSQLQSVRCEAIFPPTVSNIVPNDFCVLYVPEWTCEKYKLANGWSGFMTIDTISGIYPDDLVVQREENLLVPEDGLPQDYKPNMKITSSPSVGKLSVRGTMPLTLSLYEMQQTRNTSTMTSLIVKGSMSADSVVTKITMSANTWNYLTFPYDVKVSDIITEGGDWTICYYDGEARAQNDLGNTWKTVPYDSILHAGEGYIWHSTNGNYTVPAVRNDNRNLIFAKDTRYIQLIEHAASSTSNYGWNLIGNPYPCFYDTRFMDFTSPITVYNGSSYAAYSPEDDSYILSPNQAFFVQCSAENNVVGFDAEGRQTNNTVRTLETSAPARVHKANNERRVFNLYLENEGYAEHTRFVINEKASLGYEISRDAAKFMSDDAAIQQLFTIEGSDRMAINERPLADGEVALGAYFGKASNYTIDIDTRVTDMEVILVDKYTGTETALLTEAYEFSTEAGTFTDRFVIRVKRTADITDAIETAPTEEVKVVALTGAISITNATAPVYVYNASGALVATANDNNVTLEVAPGMYVVMVGDKAHKVSVVK